MVAKALIATAALAVAAAAPAPALASSSLTPAVRLGNYYEQNGFGFCRDDKGCDIAFSPVPTGKLLTLRRLSCSIQTVGTEISEVSLFVTRPGGLRARTLYFAPSSMMRTDVGGPIYTYGLNTEVSFPTREAPVVAAATIRTVPGSEYTLSCQISGVLTSL